MFEIGDSVVVKPGVADYDFDTEISGWQGRVEEILADEDEETMLLLHWDSITLRGMPDVMIETCIEQGLSWTTYYIEASNVEPAQPRDTAEDIMQVVEELEDRHAWAWLGEEGEGIREVLAGVDPDDDRACFAAWEKHFRKHLRFPFEAEVDEFQTRPPLQTGDRVTVRGIASVNSRRGVIVRVTRGRRQYNFPISDLEALNDKSDNYQAIQDYRVWFANR